MSNQETKHVMHLIQLLNDGVEFYQEAHEKVKDVKLKQTFERMANIRSQLLRRLQPIAIKEKGTPETGHTVAGRTRELYTQVLAKIKSDTEQAYIDNLEEIEDKTIAQIQGLIKEAQSPDVVAALEEYYPSFKKCHAEMSQLKHIHA